MSDSALPDVFRSPCFTISPCRDCDVPGYLIVQPLTQAATLAAWDAITLQEFGQVLAQAESAILTVTGAQHVYVLRFSEGFASVHFHLFPRTAALAAQWSDAHPASAADGINGPLLFAWARLTFFVTATQGISNRTRQTASRIAGELRRLHDSVERSST